MLTCDRATDYLAVFAKVSRVINIVALNETDLTLGDHGQKNCKHGQQGRNNVPPHYCFQLNNLNI